METIAAAVVVVVGPVTVSADQFVASAAAMVAVHLMEVTSSQETQLNRPY